jgi:hypothetical protein
MVRPLIADGGDALQLWREAANILNKQSRTATRGGTPDWGTRQLLVYADDVNLLGDDIETIKNNTQTLIDAGKELGLEINT